MRISEMSLMTGEQYEKPVINWEEEDKADFKSDAVIAFLLLSLDKKIDDNGMVRFDDLFGLNDTKPENEDETTDTASKGETRDAIVQECEIFLNSLDGMEAAERYDSIVDEIDRFIEGEDTRFSKCNIGGTYRTFGGKGNGKLDGNAHRLLWLVQLVISDGDYSGNKRRLLKHLARKWDIEPSTLPVLESAARLLPEIDKKRKELSESDLPHREVITKLAELDEREKEIGRQLKSLGIAETLTASAYIANQYGIINSLRSLNGEEAIRPDINEIETMPDNEDDKEPDIYDKIGDAIEEGIMKVTDIICAPFEWMTDKLMGL